MPEVTKNTIRIPLRRIKCARGSFRQKKISPRKGISMLFCCPTGKFRKGRCSAGMTAVTAIYDRKKWTPSKAKSHAKSRFKKTRRRRR